VLPSGCPAAAGNLVTISPDNTTKDGGYWHRANFGDFNQVDGFTFSVVVRAILDRSKAKLAEALTEQVMQASGRALQVAGRYVSIKRVPLGNAFGIGAAFDSGKKWVETTWGAYNDNMIKAEQAKLHPATHPAPPAKATR
jgi:hypothetical protein